MGKISTALLLLVFILASCSPDANTPADNIIGTWIFRTQQNYTYAYPSSINYPNIIAQGYFTVSSDSIQLQLNNNGTYTFREFNLAADNGTWSVWHDSLMIIHSDSSYFKGFCYSVPFGFADSLVTFPDFPDYGLAYGTDTLVFSKQNNSLSISAYWLQRTPQPIFPSGDTLALNKVMSNYTKKQ